MPLRNTRVEDIQAFTLGMDAPSTACILVNMEYGLGLCSGHGWPNRQMRLNNTTFYDWAWTLWSPYVTDSEHEHGYATGTFV